MLHLISQVLSSKLETERYVIACLFPPILCDCLSVSTGIIVAAYRSNQRWSRGHKARGQGQGHKKNPRPRTAFPRTDTLEAKDQWHKLKCSPKKKGFHKNFSGDLQKKTQKNERSLQKFFKRSPLKNVFQKIFQALRKILTIQKKCCPRAEDRPIFEDLRSRGQGQGLQNLSSRPRTSSRTLALIQLQNSIFYRQHYNLGGLSLRNYTKYTTIWYSLFLL